MRSFVGMKVSGTIFRSKALLRVVLLEKNFKMLRFIITSDICGKLAIRRMIGKVLWKALALEANFYSQLLHVTSHLTFGFLPSALLPQSNDRFSVHEKGSPTRKKGKNKKFSLPALGCSQNTKNFACCCLRYSLTRAF